jgi:hypothetical protein
MHARKSTTHALAASAIAAFVLPALAGTPDALDRVPSDAPIVVGINNVRSFLADVDQLNLMMGDQANAEMMMGIMMIRGMEGLNLDGSAAMVVHPDMDDEDDIDSETVIAIVPVSDFAALTHGREAVDGLVKYPLPENKDGYFRDIGDGFALFGDDADAIKSFDASKGRMKANESLIGKAGQGIANDSDIFMYVNLAHMDQAIDQAREGMQEQRDMVGMMGGEQAQAGVDAFAAMFESIVEDGQAFTTGINFDATKGIAFDMGIQFKPMTQAASYLNNKGGNANQYLNHIPASDYFVAASMDFSGEGMQQLMHDFMNEAEKQDTAGMLEGFNMLALAKNAKGGAQILGASNPMGMTGLLTNLYAYYESADNDAMIDSMAQIYSSADDVEVEGISIDASFDQNGTDIEGTKAHAYNMRFSMDQQGMGAGGMGGMMNPQMMMQMMFGPNLGPAGYIAEAGDGVVQTHSTDKFALARAVQAAKGKNALGSIELVQQSASMLQDNTVFEMYLGADHTLNTVGPMLMMFGVVPEFEQLPPHAPIAMGFTADGGGATMRTWVPMQVLGTIMELIPQDQMGASDQQDEEMDF